MSDSHVQVFLEEEYGYRLWVWSPAMTGEELVAWWKALPTVLPYFFSPTGLPGSLKQVKCKGDTDEDWDAFCAEIIAQTAACKWNAHIHTDVDSGLQGPDGQAYIHAGYGKSMEEASS